MSVSTFNVFQRLARQWDEIHPYNAAQILKIAGAPDLLAIQNAWHDAMEDLGLGRVRMAGTSFYYECLNGEMSLYGVRMVKPGVGLEQHISEQLNRRFDNPSEPPFRPFVVAEQGFYYLGVVYHHWVADSVSIRQLLRELFVRLYDPQRGTRTPVTLPENGYRRFFDLTDGAVGALGRSVLTAARWASSLRRVRRIEYCCGDALNVRFMMKTVRAGWINELHRAARERKVTLNDMFMAAIAMVCDEFVPLKTRPRRHGLALGAIVDLRPYSDPSIANAFGLFLGFTNITCGPAELRDPERLLKSISSQSMQQKQLGIPQTSALRMLAGVTAGKLVKPERMAHFYQKHVPMAGGISNVNMNRTWAMEYHPSPLMDYIRVSPTGPMMPLVFATTTLGSDFHFALTYRPAVVSTDRIDALASRFVERLGRYAD